MKECAVIFIAANFFFVCEYLLHRFLFHGEHSWMMNVPHNKYFYVIHFSIHGIHHAFPQDRYRIVMPPFLAGIYLNFIFKWPFFDWVVPEEIYDAWMIGFIIGMCFYEMTHYLMHHSTPNEGSYFKMMKSYHMQHHYKNGEQGYGITSKLFDKIFDTEITNDFTSHYSK